MRKDDRVCSVLEKDGKFLILKRTGKKSTDPNFMSRPDVWEFPAGTIDPGENEEEALIRETKEECGLNIKSFKFVKKWLREEDDPEKNRWIHFFHSDDFGGDILLSDEHSEFRWLSKDEILELSKKELVGIDTLHHFGAD